MNVETKNPQHPSAKTLDTPLHIPSPMVERSPESQGNEVKPGGRVIVEEAPSMTRLSFDLTATLRALHEDPNQKKTSLEEEIILLKPCRSQEEVTT